MKNLHCELHITERKVKTTWCQHYTLSPKFIKYLVKENFLHEYPRINCDILMKSGMECCAHAKAEYKLQPYWDKRIISQKQMLCSVIQHTEFAKSETNTRHIWCDFDRASSLICGNKMPTKCNRGFYCRSYCLLNMFRAPLCPWTGAQEYYAVVAACGISCCSFQVAGLVWSWGLCVRFAGCCSILQTGSITLSFTPNQQPENHSTKYRTLQTRHINLCFTPDQQLENHSTKYHRQQPLHNTLELLMVGIVVPETCWASNKICNKNLCCI